MLKGTCNLSTGHERQAFNTLKISMLDGLDTLLGEERFRVVVDQLSVDETVDTMGRDRVNLGLHLFLHSPPHQRQA